MNSSRHLRSLWSSSCAQAQVEFALVIVLLMVIILSMVELISVIHTYNVLADAANEGVRYAVVHGSGNSYPSGPKATTDIDGPAAPPGTVPGYGSGYGVVATYAQYSLHYTQLYSSSNQCTGSPGCLSITVSYPDSGTANAAPNRVQVSVTYAYSAFFNLNWPTLTLYANAEGRIMN